jgi:nitric oxide reductase subunit B
MRAVAKYVGVVVALFVVQVLLGASPRTTRSKARRSSASRSRSPALRLTRTWHIQTAVFWIATAFLAAGLFLAPAVGGREPKYQRLGVNVLFGALLVVVVGSLAGEALSPSTRSCLDRLVLVRPPGLRIRGPRPGLADRLFVGLACGWA